MKKEKFCKECNCSLGTQKYCDTCGMKLREFSIREIGRKIFNLKGNPIELEIEGEQYDFCSLECLKTFIDAELKKERTQ